MAKGFLFLGGEYVPLLHKIWDADTVDIATVVAIWRPLVMIEGASCSYIAGGVYRLNIKIGAWYGTSSLLIMNKRRAACTIVECRGNTRSSTHSRQQSAYSARVRE